MLSRRSLAALKWTATAVLVGVVSVWLASGWWYCWRIGTHAGLNVNGGMLGVVWFGADHGADTGWTLMRTPEVSLLPRMPEVGSVVGLNGAWYVTIPIWMLALPALAMAVFFRHRHARVVRSERAGLCQQCAYDRRGLPSDAICPECGAAPPVTPLPRAS